MDALHPIEIRVLGALLEKEHTTPEYYPLTLNALLNACNQKSSRDPVVNYDEDTVLRAWELLRQKGLAVRLTGAGHRVEKYSHALGEKLNLGRREIALLCVLMLRGPQTVGELRGRSERIHDFADLEEVESVLQALASRQLVTPMPRGRWAQLLGGVPEDKASLDRDPEQAHPVARAQAAGEDSKLGERVAALEREMAELKQTLANFRKQFE